MKVSAVGRVSCIRSLSRNTRRPEDGLLGRLRMRLTALSRLLLLGPSVRWLPLRHPGLDPGLYVWLRARRASLYRQELAVRAHVIGYRSWLNASLAVHLSVS